MHKYMALPECNKLNKDLLSGLVIFRLPYLTKYYRKCVFFKSLGVTFEIRRYIDITKLNSI